MTVTYVRSGPEKLTEALGILTWQLRSAGGDEAVTDALRGSSDDLEDKLLAVAREINRSYEVKPRKKAKRASLQCPKCAKVLLAAQGGGVVCSNNDCEYWHCY